MSSVRPSVCRLSVCLSVGPCVVRVHREVGTLLTRDVCWRHVVLEAPGHVRLSAWRPARAPSSLIDPLSPPPSLFSCCFSSSFSCHPRKHMVDTWERLSPSSDSTLTCALPLILRLPGGGFPRIKVPFDRSLTRPPDCGSGQSGSIATLRAV